LTTFPWLTRRRALALLAAITAIGGVLRFYNLAWSAPYYHFHIDEHYVFLGADLLRDSVEKAVALGKFFMYGPAPMHLLNGLRTVYETFTHTLDLTSPADQVAYMVLGRAISAAFGTATIPVVYAIGARLAGRAAGLVAGAFVAVTVIHIRDSHFFSVDVAMTFCSVVAWHFALRMVERNSLRSGFLAAMAIGMAVACKYTGAFSLGVLGVAYVASASTPRTVQPFAAWLRWAGVGVLLVLTAAATFIAVDPLPLLYPQRFIDDVRSVVFEPLVGISRPIWTAQFTDIGSPRLYWFTNLLWFGMGPALEAAALTGLVWLATRRTRLALVALAYPVVYFLAAGGTIAPFIRYTVPLVPGLAVAAAVLFADLAARSRARVAATAVALVVLAATSLYAAAYMNVFRRPDARLAASQYLMRRVPAGAKILVEPSHNTPPVGAYLTAMNFYDQYVVWDGRTVSRHFQLVGLDVYNGLYRGRDNDAKRAHIQSRLAEVDWIVMSDDFTEFYEHLPEAEHAVVKQYYRDLFAGRLGFTIERTFKVYPSLFGYDINDDRAELTFRLFDHPAIYIFKRRQ
jgi:hypothetical protein